MLTDRAASQAAVQARRHLACEVERPLYDHLARRKNTAMSSGFRDGGCSRSLHELYGQERSLPTEGRSWAGAAGLCGPVGLDAGGLPSKFYADAGRPGPANCGIVD